MQESNPVEALRKRLGLTQEAFAPMIGLANKASVSLIEKGGSVSLSVALAVEKLSAGEIDAATLNADIAAARDGMVRPSWMLTDAEIDALPGGSDAEPCFDAAGDAAAAEAFDRVIICDVCEARVDAKRGCAFVDCPHRRELAA